MIARSVRRIFWLAVIVWGLTTGAVLYRSDANLQAYGDGRGLTDTVDAVVVLGAGADGDGLLGYDSRRRVVPAVALLETGRIRNVIFSGRNADGFSDNTIAGLMRDYAISLGAPPDRLIAEPNASTTLQNLRYSFAIAEERGFTRLAVLTDAFHLERARALAGFLGHPEIGLVAADGLRDDSRGNRYSAILREALAWWYNGGKLACWTALGWAGLSETERERFIR